MEQGSSILRMQLHNEQNLANDQLNSSFQELPVENELRYRKMGTNDFQPSSFELLASLQRKETQVGTSFSEVPLRGEFLPQFGGGFEDHSAAYGINPQSHDQQQYNLPSEFYCLPSSSRLQGEHIGSTQNLAQFGSSAVDPSIDGVQKNATMLENLFPSRSITNQDISYSMNTTSGFELGIDSSSNGKNPTTSLLKRKMSWQDEETQTNGSRNFLGRSYQRYSPRTIGGRYSLYDKRYEDIGLPVDPHLRIFNAANGNGNGESSTKKI